jgi:hypothetical protein
MKKKHGIILVVIGIVLIAASMYINTQVLHGREQIASAQSKKDTGEKFMGMGGSTTKEVGKIGGAMMQGKIDEGSAKAAKFAKIAMALKGIGIIAVIAGGVIIFVKRKKS